MEETTTNTAHFLDLLFMLTDDESKTKPVLLSPSTGFMWQMSVNQEPQWRPTMGHLSSGEDQMLPDSHLYNTENSYIKKL